MLKIEKFRGISFGVLLAGKIPTRQKTQTRRVLKFKVANPNLEFAVVKTEYEGMFNYSNQIDTGKRVAHFQDNEGNEFIHSLPYRIGEILYVREPWHTLEALDKLMPSQLRDDAEIAYLADCGGDVNASVLAGRKRQARYMMKRYARSFIKVRGMRVERLKSISTADAIAEGIDRVTTIFYDDAIEEVYRDYSSEDSKAHAPSAIDSFKSLWDDVNHLPSQPKCWQNPLVLVIDFDFIDMPNPYNLRLPWDGFGWTKCDGEWMACNHDHISGVDYAATVTLICDGDSDKWPWKWRISIGGKIKDEGKMDTAEAAKEMAQLTVRMKLEHLHIEGWEGFGL